MTARSVQDWFLIIQRDKSDLVLCEQLLADLAGYHGHTRPDWKRDDLQQVLNLLTALRLDQMAKENHHGT